MMMQLRMQNAESKLVQRQLELAVVESRCWKPFGVGHGRLWSCRNGSKEKFTDVALSITKVVVSFGLRLVQGRCDQQVDPSGLLGRASVSVTLADICWKFNSLIHAWVTMLI
jgi:hypothetical protein